MKCSTFIALFSFSFAVIADFDMYHGKWMVLGEFEVDRDIWQIFQTDPNCDQAWNTPVTDDSYDVSGNKLGVRCVGSGCDGSNDPWDIDLVEMHYSNNPLYHWTIYKNRDSYAMIGLDGRVYGNCDPFPSVSYYCPQFASWIRGDRKFRCYTQFTAAQINEGRNNH